MKKTLSVFILLLIVFPANAQQQKNSLHGKILDRNNNALAGASVIIVGTNKGVHSNEAGEYLFDQIPPERIKVQASFVGFKTLIIDFDVQPGKNDLDLILDFSDIKLEEVTVTSQNRDQQVLDVPITMSVINSQFMKANNITEPDGLSEFVPGLLIRMQGVSRPSFVIRGLTSDEVSPAAQPRISVFYNNVPISRANGAAVALFDMQQVDVLKGPQGTLFGRGAEIGAINYVSNKPADKLTGNLTAGIGTFNQKELSGAINIPVAKNKLFFRAAAICDYEDGYIKNTFGGALNGKKTMAGRFSAKYLPSVRNKLDLVLNYQKDDNPGLGFMSMSYPNTRGSNNPFGYVASNEQADNLADRRDIYDATLNMKHFFNENSYLTAISSYRKIDSYTRWDGDGTAAAAIDMSEDDRSGQFYQEVRYNYSIKNKLNGSIGTSYWFEKARQNYWFSPNEQDLVHLFLNTGLLVGPDGQPDPLTNLPPYPQLGPLGGMPLVTDHQEENLNNATNSALDGFADANYQLTGKFSITGGVRVTSDWIRLTNSGQMTGGSPATLGYLSGNYPNVFFKISDKQEISTANLALTYRAGLKYSFNENSNIFVNYSKGHRPKVLQFTSAGEEQILHAETVNSLDLGFKTAIQQRLWFDLGLFCYGYLNFQTSAWVADANTGEFNYIVKDGGKANGYGAEASIKYVILNGLKIFGNYSYIHARFAENDADGSKQEYAGNMFRLTPKHSFAFGINARVKIAGELYLFGNPSYTYKTKIFFEDSNTAGLEQNGYGLLDLNAGIEFKKMALSFWVRNLLDEKYIISAGNTGSLFGDPTQIPGAPRMTGTKLSWNF